jgi:ribosomal-protein-alanine N-acetyltransferase
MWFLRRKAPPVIRPLRPEKAEDCARLHASAFAYPWSGEEFAVMLASPSTIGVAALDPSRATLRGFVVSRLGADEAEILTVAVEPAMRGAGVGRALVGEHLRQAANAGARAIFLEVDEHNAPALALYRRHGFVKVGERAGYYRRPDGEAAKAIVMRKDLA